MLKGAKEKKWNAIVFKECRFKLCPEGGVLEPVAELSSFKANCCPCELSPMALTLIAVPSPNRSFTFKPSLWTEAVRNEYFNHSIKLMNNYPGVDNSERIIIFLLASSVSETEGFLNTRGVQFMGKYIGSRLKGGRAVIGIILKLILSWTQQEEL